MGIVITWSLFFWIIAAVIAIWALAYFLLRVAYAIALDENAPDVPMHPGMSSPDEGTTEFPAATDKDLRKKITEFGRRHPLPLDPLPPRSFFRHYSLADVAESWKSHGTAALNKVAVLRTGHDLHHRFRKARKASRKIVARSRKFIFVKSGDFFQRRSPSRTFLHRSEKAREALVFFAEPLIGQFRKVRRLFLRRHG